MEDGVTHHDYGLILAIEREGGEEEYLGRREIMCLTEEKNLSNRRSECDIPTLRHPHSVI